MPKKGQPRGKARPVHGDRNAEPQQDPKDIQIIELAKGKDELEERLAYMTAEFENLKKRCGRDVEVGLLRAKESLFLDILCVMDNMDRALAQVNGGRADDEFAKGVRMIHHQMKQVLVSHGLTPIEALGQPFDPFRHEALMKVEDMDKADGIILEEIVKGYTLENKVIRPAKVKVNVLTKPAK